MPPTLVQLGTTDRDLLSAARQRAGGEVALSTELTSELEQFGRATTPIILSTCERTELYTLARADDVGLVADIFARHLAASPAHTNIDRRIGAAVIAHLFAVATGLESRLIGESHILGQVSRAQPCQSTRSASSLLARLFQDAVACGRHTRRLSGLDQFAISSVSLALAHVQRIFPIGARTAVIGSGVIAREMATRLATQGFTVTVLARHHERAAVGLPANIPALPLHALNDHISSCSLIVAATSSPVPIIKTAQLMPRTTPLVVIDFGVPPNVDADVHTVANTIVITLDDLLDAHQRPCRIYEYARTLVNVRADRWAKRWLSSDSQVLSTPSLRSTVA